QLLDYQWGMFWRSCELFQIPRNRWIIQMPTGSGKTRTAMELIHTVLDAPENHNAIILWLAHSEELCEQAIDCFVSTRQHVGRFPSYVVRMWGNQHRGPLPQGRTFVVITYQKLVAMYRSEQNTEDFRRSRLVILDEAHMAVAPQYNKAIQNLLREGTSTLVGLTATPIRTIESETLKLREFFLDNLVAITDGGKNDLNDLLKRGILSHPTFELIETEQSFELTTKEISDLENQFDFPPGLLKRIGSHDLRNGMILRRLQELVAEGRSILLFACSVDHSRFLASTLEFLGVRAHHLDGTMDRGARSSAISDFRHKKVRVLCNYGVLTTGFDAPNTDVVFIARPTSSPVLYSQMVGRGMRGPRMGGNTSFRVIDVRDNFFDHGQPLDLFARFQAKWQKCFVV
ncbi:MAG TPA: DEAD/DEAH box helicase, partial [Candidatus Ozemobacteraceae bacterium]|nr:DEAD/DEAH box helicase [Candidatus Ozemobacteraceae bacterium]